MNELALFAGIGGGILGTHSLGFRTVCAVEREQYPIEVLCQRQNDGILPRFPIWDDVCSFDGRPWRGIVDLVSGGFPCQFASTAARGRNIASNLWPEMWRIVSEISPRFVLVENVAGAKKAMQDANNDLQFVGFQTSGVFSFSGKDAGANHQRIRLWIVGYSDNGGQPTLKEHEEASRLQEPSAVGFGDWPTLPHYPRMDDGSSRRVDRQKAIGNGQIPRVAAGAFIHGISRIKEQE